MTAQEKYNSDYRHVDNLIWAVPAWSTAIFSLSMTTAALILRHGNTIQSTLNVNAKSLLIFFLWISVIVLLILMNVFLRFRVNQRHIPQVYHEEKEDLWFTIKGQTALLFLLFVETTATLCLILVTYRIATPYIIVSALVFLVPVYLYVEWQVQEISITFEAVNKVTEALNIVKRAKELGDYDSGVIGMVAEIIAEEDLGMIKASAGKKDIDGYWYKENTETSVQVKAFSSGRVSRYKGGTFFRVPVHGADSLIVILIFSNEAKYEVLYNGKTTDAGSLEKNGSSRIVKLSSLKTKEEVNNILSRC